MSIAKMIALHPDVAGDINDALATAARHAMFCDLMCSSCADACVAEEMDMRQCIRTCLDCADVCAAIDPPPVASRRIRLGRPDLCGPKDAHGALEPRPRTL